MKNLMGTIALVGAFMLSVCTASCDKFMPSNELETDSIHYRDSTEKMVFDITADYPTGGSKYLVQNILEWMNESMGGTYDGELTDTVAMFSHYSKEWQKEYTQYPDMQEMLDGMDCDLERSYSFKLEFENDKLVTYVLTAYSYDGGVHGGMNVQGVTFRKSDGRRFGWEMVKSDAQLNPYIKRGLKEYFEVESDNDLMDNLQIDEWQSIDNLPTPDTAPWIDAKGLHLQYQQYEIACYAAGMPSVDIPLASAKEMLVSSVADCLK